MPGFKLICVSKMGWSEFSMNASQWSSKNIYIYAASYSVWQSWSVWYTGTIHPGKETSGCAIYHYSDVIMSTIASLITSLAVVYSTVYSDADQRKHQSSASLAFVWGIHRDRWIPRTKGQLRGNVSIWWRHHVPNEGSVACAVYSYLSVDILWG